MQFASTTTPRQGAHRALAGARLLLFSIRRSVESFTRSCLRKQIRQAARHLTAMLMEKIYTLERQPVRMLMPFLISDFFKWMQAGPQSLAGAVPGKAQ
jgi:hypothetical protein